MGIEKCAHRSAKFYNCNQSRWQQISVAVHNIEDRLSCLLLAAKLSVAALRKGFIEIMAASGWEGKKRSR